MIVDVRHKVFFYALSIYGSADNVLGSAQHYIKLIIIVIVIVIVSVIVIVIVIVIIIIIIIISLVHQSRPLTGFICDLAICKYAE